MHLIRLGLRFWMLPILGMVATSLTVTATDVSNEIRIIQIEGTVELMPAGASTWVLTRTNQVLHPGDRLRAGENSRVLLRWSDQSVVPFAALSEIEILPPDKADALPGLKIVKGIVSFFHRDKPGRIRILTRGATASIEGTELVLEVTETGGEEHITLSVLDGRVRFANDLGSLTLTNAEQAVIEPGHPPIRTAGFVANNIMQWCFYYPAVLDPDELILPSEAAEVLQASFAAYRSGDLLKALAEYPIGRKPLSDAERTYHASLLLAVGEVAKTEAQLDNLSAKRDLPLADSLRTVIAAVKHSSKDAVGHTDSKRLPTLAAELLAESYFVQVQGKGDASLAEALALARRATAVSPKFGFAWARVAELEFEFGRTRIAEAALDTGLDLMPRNAQAIATKGFILAAHNDIREAQDWFDQAIAVDPALGNAWLGRGLCRIRRGDAEGGRGDLLVAAAREPQRSLLRSYLGKAFADAGETSLANRELERAVRLDPNDPTAWLYSALLKQRENRINEAIGDLEQSQRLNDNRALFRSRLLLDQDKAVRSANLAAMYRDAGMGEVGVVEAARAVTYDYANDSAHLFLSDNFNELRDPTRFNLRQETVWFNELLLANLLAPVGGGRLSQTVTANEYSKLFEADGLGAAGLTSWRSDDQFRQLLSQYGTYGNTAWAFDVDYQHNAGVRPNNELDRLEWYTTLKQQITPQDTLLVLAKYQDYSSGDNFQYYDPSASFRTNFTFEEHQEPILVAGFQHEWSPGSRTLLLGGRLVNEQEFSDLQTPQLLLIENGSGTVVATDSQRFDARLKDDLEIYTLEANQVLQSDNLTIVGGALGQTGGFDFSHALTNPTLPPGFLPPNSAAYSEDFGRLKAYGYLTVEAVDALWLTAGFAYDWVKMPSNFRSLPQSAGTEHRELPEPKAAIVWTPCREATLRGIYAKSLGGVSLDESYRLEPTQLAGFAQSFRTVISESIAGSVAAPETEVMGLALDLKPWPGAFVGVQYERINSDVERSIGVFRLENSVAPFIPSTTRESLDYTEDSLFVYARQMLGDRLVVGADYRLTRANLKTVLPEVPGSAMALARRDETAYLHQIGGYLLYNHPTGFFARFDANYYQQSNSGYGTAMPGDDFVQLDLQAGYRFWQRRAEMAIGVLNLGDQDYHLNPLTLYSELPRERVFVARFGFRF